MSWVADIFGTLRANHVRKKKGAPPQLSREEVVARGTALARLLAEPGWQIALDFMESRMDRAEHEMLTAKTADLMELLGLQRRARAYREMFDGVQQDIARAVDDAREDREEQ